jgi:AcrR family transcriptional regulator
MSVTDNRVDGRIERGNQTRRAILGRAMNIASAEGLEGLSIGRLASELDVSKSGVFAHFGSKEELQLATVRAASRVFYDGVVAPALEAPPGIARVWRLYQSWLDYLRARSFPGGCFFFAVAGEFDARPGRVRDRIAEGRLDFTRFCQETIAEARELGELEAGVDPRQLAFELDAFGRQADAEALLHDDDGAYDRGRTAMLGRLRAVTTDPSTLPA